MAKKSTKKSLSLTLRNYFIAGVVVLIPIGFTLYLTKILIGISSNLIPKNINPNSYLPFNIPGVEIVISILLITIVGGLSLSFFGIKFEDIPIKILVKYRVKPIGIKTTTPVIK